MKKNGNKLSLTNAEVISSLKHCVLGRSCGIKCPYYETQYRCRSKDLMLDAIKVMERQQKEISALKKERASQEGTV